MKERLNRPGSMKWNLEADIIRLMKSEKNNSISPENDLDSKPTSFDGNCIHHWKIESPSEQSTCHAFCLHCGQERDYNASALTLAPEYRNYINAGKKYGFEYGFDYNDLAKKFQIKELEQLKETDSL